MQEQQDIEITMGGGWIQSNSTVTVFVEKLFTATGANNNGWGAENWKTGETNAATKRSAASNL
jgi:hypothetical protein